jgi:hypothetical protein
MSSKVRIFIGSNSTRFLLEFSMLCKTFWKKNFHKTTERKNVQNFLVKLLKFPEKNP